MGLLVVLILSGCATEDRPWNVLFITLDTTRADFLGCYGKESARTPNLDRVAEEGTLFLHALSSVPVTLPSHSTLFTGTYPLVHGVRDNGLFRLPSERQTLAEILKDQGYATGAAIGAFPLTREFGLDQGFDYYNDHISIAGEDYRGRRQDQKSGNFFEERPADRVNDAILPWLRENAERPFFAWIHYWDPHHPHIPPAPYDQLYSHDLYQGEIAFVDQNFGVILRELENQGIADRTLIVISGDHGEGRGEHNEDTHSLLSYDSTLRVPFLIKAPGFPAGIRISERVGTVDALPTILDLLGLEAPDEVQGRSLVSQLRGEAREGNRRAYYAETLSPRLSHGLGELRAFYKGSYKYIHGPRPELYDLGADPDELSDLVAQKPEIGRSLESDLAAFVVENAGSQSSDAVHEVDDETRQRLAALGYISSSGSSNVEVQEVLSREGTPPQDRVRDVNLLSRWRQYAAVGNFLEAKETALRLIARDPENPSHHGLLARSYYGLGQIDRAADVIRSRAVSVRNPSPLLDVANQVYAQGNRELGAELVTKINAAVESAHGQYLWAEMLGDQGDPEGRRQSLRRALELDSTHIRSRLSLAIDQAQLGDLAAAEDHFRLLLKQHPRYSRGHFNFAVFLLHHERTREALDRLERAVQLNPSYWQAHLARLTAHLRLGERQQAVRIKDLLERRCPHRDIVQQAASFLADPWVSPPTVEAR